MKIIFDTDPGIDDAMALLYLSALPDIELIGITTIHGNASIEDCTRNALYLCEHYSIKAPVFQGEATSFSSIAPEKYPDFVHGADGLGNTNRSPSSKVLDEMSAVDFLIKSLKDYPGEITILAVGRLTNLAKALEKEPELQELANEVIFMGGTIKAKGNVSAWAEANIFGDPEAAAIVFSSRLKLTMVGLDVTNSARMTLPFVESLVPENDEISTFLVAINQYYADFYRETEGTDDFPIHDSSAVAYLHDPSIFETKSGNLRCILDGKERGRTVFQEDRNGIHKVCMKVNPEQLLRNYAAQTKSKYNPHEAGTPRR